MENLIRSGRGKHAAGVLALAAAGCLLAPAARSQAPAGPAVTVHIGQAEGRFVPERYTNVNVDAVYGQTANLLADAAFQWVRATNALSYVRCYTWLGDGIPKDRPEWLAGCRVARYGPNEQPVYQWEALERVLDTLVASGLKPVIVCGGIPDAMAAGAPKRNEGGAAVNRPKDYAQYQDMIAQMVRRLEKTYGPEEVRTWYFEAWSQPDHEGSWEGGRPAPFQGEVTEAAVAPFLKLYDHFVAGATSVDPKLRIGGPGLAGDLSFLRRFLEHCARGSNGVSGGKGARLDFVSWCRFGPAAEIARWNEELRKLVETGYPELKGLQYLLVESGPGPAAGERASTAEEAARLAALVDATARSPQGADLLFRSGDLIDDHFDGARPLVTRIGANTVPTPAFRLNMMLVKMGGERVKTETPPGIGALAVQPVGKSQKNAAQVLVYRYTPGAPADGKPEKVTVRFAGLPANVLQLPARIYRIDPETNAPYEAWAAAGKPRPAPEALGEKLAGSAPFAPEVERPAVGIVKGATSLEVSLPPNGVALVTLGAEPSYEVKLSKRAERLRKAETDFAKAAEAERRGDLPGTASLLKQVAERYDDTYWREVALYSLVGLYEVELKSPNDAEAARKRLLTLPIDDILRLRLLQRLRVDAVRRQETAAAEAMRKEADAIEARLTALRQWPLKRYTGE